MTELAIRLRFEIEPGADPTSTLESLKAALAATSSEIFRVDDIEILDYRSKLKDTFKGTVEAAVIVVHLLAVGHAITESLVGPKPADSQQVEVLEKDAKELRKNTEELKKDTEELKKGLKNLADEIKKSGVRVLPPQLEVGRDRVELDDVTPQHVEKLM